MAKKKKKKRVLKIKNIIILLLILVAILALFYYAMNMPIHNIYIKGNKIVTDDEIIEETNLYTYPSFLLVKSKNIKQSLLKNNYIKDVKVKKKLGNILELTIEEFRVIALTKEGIIILETGKKLENNYGLNDIPILINEISNEEIYKNFTNAFSKINQNILRQVSEIEYSPVPVDDSRFLLYMNDGNLVYITLTKITKLNKYNNIKDKITGKKGIIYLDAGDYIEIKKEEPQSKNPTQTPDNNNQNQPPEE